MPSPPYEYNFRRVERGLSFLEVLVAVGIVALLSTAATLVNRDRLPIEQQLGEVRQVAGRLTQYVAEARLSRSVFRFTCTADGITATRHDSTQYSPVFTYAQAQTASGSPSLGSFTLESPTNPIGVTCPDGNVFFISPRGEVLGATNKAGVTLEFASTFSALRVGDNTSATTMRARLLVSGEGGATRIFLGDSATGVLGEQP